MFGNKAKIVTDGWRLVYILKDMDKIELWPKFQGSSYKSNIKNI